MLQLLLFGWPDAHTSTSYDAQSNPAMENNPFHMKGGYKNSLETAEMRAGGANTQII